MQVNGKCFSVQKRSGFAAKNIHNGQPSGYNFYRIECIGIFF